MKCNAKRGNNKERREELMKKRAEEQYRASMMKTKSKGKVYPFSSKRYLPRQPGVGTRPWEARYARQTNVHQLYFTSNF